MNVLLLVSFRAPLGGLQAHVLSQARAIRRAGGRATIHCPEGPFATSLREEGFDVLGDSNGPLDAEAARLVGEAGDVDLIHAHPFRSRMLGERVKARLDIPLVLTLHSQYLDSVDRKHPDIDLVLAISDACRDYVLANSDCPPEKIRVLHNGVDLDAFYPRSGGDKLRSPLIATGQLGRGNRVCLVVSRLDRDKSYLLDLLCGYWTRYPDPDLAWLIVGDGTERERMEAEATRNLKRSDSSGCRFVGWRSGTELLEAYWSADCVVAPGRCALEALACGRPVLALGSRGYVGPVPGYGALAGMYSNFGGVDKDTDSSRPVDRFAKDLWGLLELLDREDSLADACREFVTATYDQQSLDRSLMATYRLLLSG